MSAETRGRGGEGSGVERVVGIGSSAGGLEALQDLVGGLVPGSGSAYVVAQHLSPQHPSVLVELLARATQLRVVAAVDGQALEADNIVVVPPSRDVVVVGDRLSVGVPEARRGPSPGIDRLFESIAREWGPRGVGVILSGTGSDGAHGLRAIKAADGLTMVQVPESARFDSMPRSAIALGAVDLVLDPADMAQRLGGLSGTGVGGWFGDSLPDEPTPVLETVTSVLLRHTGIDFSGFKESTLRRQLNRRMAVRQTADVEDYLAVLAASAGEPDALMANLLVTVTSFFRDREAFEALSDQLQDYVDSRVSEEQLRVWVPGCATGEEVYSLAMVFARVLGHPDDLADRLKIFATDLDEASLAIARHAVYPLSCVEQIPADLRAEYCVLGTQELEITADLRRCTVFARHNVTEDPPFPRLDLVSCRNTLIYFTTPLQDRAVAGIRYGLLPGGMLFLGALETVGPATAGFRVIDGAHRIFSRTDAPVPAFVPSGHTSAWTPPRTTRARGRVVRGADSDPAGRTELLEALVGMAAHPCVVLDDDHVLVEVVGDVSPYCRMRPGPASVAAESFLRPELLAEARALLLVARADGGPSAGRSIPLDGGDETVRLEARPLTVAGRSLMVLWFIAVRGDEATTPRTVKRDAAFDVELERLERELLVGQDTWRQSLSELETTYEELQASTEELQGASEELQASYEELETANEELQAVNEELGGVNQQLRHRGDQLQGLNTDLENIQASVSQGMILVDADLRVTRFSPLAVRVFALVDDADIGRPLQSVPTTMPVPGLGEALRAVVSGGERVSLNVLGDDVSYLVQVLPYRDGDGQRRGAIVTLTDVTELQRARVDEVTGLLSRKSLWGALEVEMARAGRSHRPMGLLWIDIDRFKEVNDRNGHETGDHVLRTVAQKVQSVIRKDELVGRLGGDEFGVVLSGYEGPGGLDSALDRILAALRQPMQVDGVDIAVSGSVGVALHPEDGGTPDDLMRSADAAMYAAKAAGGDRFAFYQRSMTVAAEDRRHMRGEVSAAIQEQAFQMYYQPIVATADGAAWGAEALVRWHRGGQVVTAGDFIGFCEDSGQIRSLGPVVLSLLSRDLRTLRATGRGDLPISVNMSVTQLEDRHTAHLLTTWPASSGLSHLVLEVTESVFLPDNSRAMELLQDLKRLGAEVSVDDYGSGFSNLRLLRALAPSFIKLDRSFLAGDTLGHQAPAPLTAAIDLTSDTSQPELALIKSAIEMAHALGATVVVEGIETQQHHDLATHLGADLIQGFGIAEPMPMPDLIQWLHERSPTPN